MTLDHAAPIEDLAISSSGGCTPEPKTFGRGRRGFTPLLCFKHEMSTEYLRVRVVRDVVLRWN